MKALVVLVMCLLIIPIVACSQSTGEPYPSISEAEAVLAQVVGYVETADLEGLSKLEPSSMVEQALHAVGGFSTAPNEPPTIVDTFIRPTVKCNGGQATGGRILVLEGVDNLGRSYHSEMLVFREPGELRVINSIYWTNSYIARLNPDCSGNTTIQTTEASLEQSQ
jgi:hypothetical protein